MTTELAVRAMRWRLAPGRFLKRGSEWISRTHFTPLRDINHAFLVLNAVSRSYSIAFEPRRCYTVEVNAFGRFGHATGKSTARVICLALAQVLQIDF